MCSIMGIETTAISETKVRACFDRTLSRGPDMSRLVRLPCGYLGFHRLAIMGLEESGMQPFQMDGSYVVCNGELYGFRPIRERLKEKYAFVSESDCEILLPLWREYGLEMFQTLDAEFALILYDAELRQNGGWRHGLCQRASKPAGFVRYNFAFSTGLLLGGRPFYPLRRPGPCRPVYHAG